MNETFVKVKKIATWTLAIILIVILFIPYVWFIMSLRKQGKTLQIIPEFKIINIKTEGQENTEVYTSAVKKAKDSLKKVEK